jgi:hypothetical protein
MIRCNTPTKKEATMSDNTLSPQDAEQIKNEAAAAAEDSTDLRDKVREMTLRALRSRELKLDDVKSVVGAVSEGVSLGLGKRGGEVKVAASEALAGLDEAVKKFAEATKLAAEQLLSQGKEFSAQDLKPVYETLKRLEGELLDTVSHAADTVGGRVKQEFSDLVSHARRSGTDTGRLVADTVAEFNSRMATTLKEGATEGTSAAKELSKRLAVVTSGILSAMAQALHDKATGASKKAD